MLCPDETYQAIVEELPGELQALAREAPYRLGLTSSVEDSWDEFVALAPNRDLPTYACDGLALSRQDVAAYSRAHHAAGFYGIVVDRLADGQVSRTPAWMSLRRALLRGWERRLSIATGDPLVARSAIARAMAEWRGGSVMEREGLRDRDLTSTYGQMIDLKLAWISATTCCMLRQAGEAGRAAALRRTYHFFLCALQCRDDAGDAAEDHALHGVDVPTALGVSRGALFRAATVLLALAIRTAEEGGLLKLADWMASFAPKIDVFVEGGVALHDQIIGMVVAQRVADARG